MYEQIQQWPSPIDKDNYKKLEYDSLLNYAKSNNVDAALRLYKIINNVGTALNKTSIKNLQPEISMSFEEIEQRWVRFLESVRQAANNDQNQLNNPNIFVDGNWSTVNIVYDASNDKFALSDSYIFTDWNAQKDFGLLYELGKSINDVRSAATGGARSPITNASRESIKAQESDSKKSIEEFIESKKAEAISSVSSAKINADWSEFYRERCNELKKDINGEIIREFKLWKFPKSRYKKAGLKHLRNVWFFILLGTLFIYALIAGLIFTGQGIFKIDSSIDENLKGFGRYFIGLTLYGVLAGMFLGYSYASRQLKIHQNLLEQYRHREIVSKTISGVVSAVMKSKSGTATPEEQTDIDKEELQQLVKVAASAMFEYRTIGHLSAKEGNSILSELINSRNT